MIEKKLVQYRNRIDLLEQDNSDLRKDLVERMVFNKLMLDSRLELLYRIIDLEKVIQKYGERIKNLEDCKVKKKLNLFEWLSEKI